MRVIAGRARGRKLAPVPGEGTRPITDRAKEALFGVLGAAVEDARVLDLFAGTGGVGIEALSRGAAACDFVEASPGAARTIRANLEQTGLAGAHARVMRRDVFALLGDRPPAAFDLVYVAPPQYRGLWERALRALDARPEWVAPEGTIVVQIHPREEAPLALEHFAETDRRTYGSVRLQFYRARGADHDGD